MVAVFFHPVSQRVGMKQNLIVLADSDGDLLVYKIEENLKIDPKVYWRDNDSEEIVIIANDFIGLKVVVYQLG